LGRGASLVAVAAAMALTGTAVAVVATWEGAWPGRCEGVRGGARRSAGEAGGAQSMALTALQPLDWPGNLRVT